jgi:hypothetical protein
MSLPYQLLNSLWSLQADQLVRTQLKVAAASILTAPPCLSCPEFFPFSHNLGNPLSHLRRKNPEPAKNPFHPVENCIALFWLRL